MPWTANSFSKTAVVAADIHDEIIFLKTELFDDVRRELAEMRTTGAFRPVT